MLSKNFDSSTHSATLQIWWQNWPKWQIWKKLKCIFGVKFGDRVKFKLKNILKAIIKWYPENFDLLDLFLSRIW